ncbi:MAG: N-acetylmuramoyl-L-alanine amidase [Myxococcota bacterium]|nr:N-acetylmuramoyl-L-alanine amidase [Myxococcota bacterium]
MPSILFEASFLSNPEDERRLRTPHFQDQLATGLMKAIDHYFEIQE